MGKGRVEGMIIWKINFANTKRTNCLERSVQKLIFEFDTIARELVQVIL